MDRGAASASSTRLPSGVTAGWITDRAVSSLAPGPCQNAFAGPLPTGGMDLASLPTRPLSLEECRDLENSDRFRTLVPAGVFDLAESDRRLVPAAVLVTDRTVAAVGYVLAVDADDTAADDHGGWTVVAEREAPEGKDALEELVRAVGADLREWAEAQAWAEDPSALVEAL